ncbi:MAG: hypothetical protein HFJ09_08015 [Lachnospiraceae bacterium]|nr:hypothetical protein [Lachnospiraceae bacterium]
MTEQQWKEKNNEKVKQIIDYIANQEYSKLHTITKIDSSWFGDKKTQMEGIEIFAEWLEEQLKIWSEDEGKEFVIDPYNEKYFKIQHFEEDQAFAVFQPHSHNEELDFWFEFTFFIHEDDNIISEFNINI